jgi:polysaccharide biosynthesis/export protein
MLIVKKYRNITAVMATALAILISISSCTSIKKIAYVNNLTDSAAFESIKKAQNNFENLIQKNDQLWITVGGSNLIDLGSINSASGFTSNGGGLASNGNSVIGYLVEADGHIQLPYVGRVKAEGISRLALENLLTNLLKDYTKNPTVNVRFLNYSFSILGEVLRPGKYTMSSERTTLFEAIGTAGDLTDIARRDNILIVREVNGVRSTERLNLLSKDIFNSPYFYLKTNDVIIVQALNVKYINRTGVPQYISIAAIGISLLLTVINLIK